MGRGDEKAADQAAVDAMRTRSNSPPIDGTVVIGEGERDEAPMLFIGEKVGAGGRRSTSPSIRWRARRSPRSGGPERPAVVAMAEAGGFFNAPDTYMDKIVVGPGHPEGIVRSRRDAAGENLKTSPRRAEHGYPRSGGLHPRPAAAQ